jgi:hypothetical protein
MRALDTMLMRTTRPGECGVASHRNQTKTTAVVYRRLPPVTDLSF